MGLAVATAGLVLSSATVGTGGVTMTGLVLTLSAAASWAVGNVLMRGCGGGDRLALVVWLSVIPPIPMLLLSMLVDGPGALQEILRGDVWITSAAVLYIAVAATLGGYGLWGHLLRLYPATSVAPFIFSCLCLGLSAERLGLGEQFDAFRLAGIVLVCVGLLIGVLPQWPRSVVGSGRL